MRALPLATGTNEVGHYFCPSVVRVLSVAAGTTKGGQYYLKILLLSFPSDAIQNHRTIA